MAIRILMVDDDASVLEMAKSTVTSLKWCELVTVDDGQEAEEYLQNEKFDGLITTDRIPVLSGFELVLCVKHSPINAGIPVVMLTTDDDVDTMRRGFKAGVTFFSSKPTNRERFHRLFNAVRGAMETERRRHHRLPYRTQVNCSLDEGRRRFVAETGEIGEGGLSLKPTGGVKPGDILDIEFLLPQLSRPAHQERRKAKRSIFVEREAEVTGPQKIRARVRYLTPSGESMGLDFLTLTPAQREVIQHYITGGS